MNIKNIFRAIPTIAIFFIFISPGTAYSEVVHFVSGTSPYCPYTRCDKARDGFVIDIVKAIYTAEGYAVQIQEVPWNRALAMVGNGRADGILGVVKKSAPALIYPHTEVAQYNAAFFALKTNPWVYDGVPSLKNVRLGLVQNYGYAEGFPELEEYLNTKSNNVSWIANTDPLLHIFMMIEAGHIEATLEDVAVASFMLETTGRKELYKIAGRPEQSNVPAYVGFAPSAEKSRHLAELFDDGMAKLRKSGALKTILAAYGMSDWKK